MIGTLISLLPTVMSLFSSNKAHNEYGKDLNALRASQHIDPALLGAQRLYAENATRGLPGYEDMRSEIEATIPETINQGKDFLTGTQAIQMLGSARANADKQLRALSVQNEQARMNNMDEYAKFLSGPMAAYGTHASDQATELGVASAFNKADKGASATKILNGLSNNLSAMSDEDLSKLIALFSKAKGIKPAGGPTPDSNMFNENYT